MVPNLLDPQFTTKCGHGRSTGLTPDVAHRSILRVVKTRPFAGRRVVDLRPSRVFEGKGYLTQRNTGRIVDRRRLSTFENIYWLLINFEEGWRNTSCKRTDAYEPQIQSVNVFWRRTHRAL